MQKVLMHQQCIQSRLIHILYKNMKKLLQHIVMVTLGVIAVFGVYHYMWQGVPVHADENIPNPAMPTMGIKTQKAGDGLSSGSAVGDILELSNKLNSITIDGSLFTSPVFQSLVDTSVPITPENSGRPNPFNVIGFDDPNMRSSTDSSGQSAGSVTPRR
jgi:hypothetical protein